MSVADMGGFFERRFHLAEHRTTPRTEVLAGLTTFLTLAYILFVQPALLSSVGLDFGAVFVATCVASAFATLLMAGLANYPIAVAPAMGHNFYFTFTVVVAMEVPWEVALGGVAVAGLLFIATAGFGLRERLIIAIPASLKHAIATGIGLLIAMIGLQWAGIIVASPGTLVTLGDLRTAPVLVSLMGLVVMAVLWARGVRVAILLGVLVSTFAAWLGGLVQYQGVASLPPSLMPTLGQFDILGALRPDMVAVIFVFFFLALFDSVGTLVGVGEQAGLMRNGTLPRARGALLADAVGTVVGAGLGTSTVTAYIESATGVAAGGRTGLTAVVIALLFLLSLFLSPLVSMIGGGYDAGGGVTLYPVVAPALILVGTMMVRGVRQIDWDDPTESLPSFLTLMVMPLAVSVTDGIAFGFIAYALLKLVTGRGREAHWLVYLFAVLFLVRYAVLV
ncbi:MAG: guanine permease [Acidobacteria bacterium]|jgi:AGZA family xanthine/uracil permease-like MFS transporter|nr:guanine permease [Acidobacteriota bacterium]MDP7338230.1 NCS2 family permease [Vicinamibacterales bacterium]MDP7479143.1 NCS2 family permease [Vicinamibacterales bacterium]MDP7691062.1 NCS2 family permease [Vicinamibacterales bacterium]HJN44437.1 NCS2 family permease [Vicinamibacterales bacterium]|tara:strand:- start:84 stop:1430 length:1347 start_codon:yes stop_codon:yes gene_type:complete